MVYSCFIGITSSKLSGEVEEYLREYRLIKKREGKPSYVIGIDWGYNILAEPEEVPVVIGDWRD